MLNKPIRFEEIVIFIINGVKLGMVKSGSFSKTWLQVLIFKSSESCGGH